MDEWNTTQHGKSGLIKRVKETCMSAQEAERLTLEFLHKHVDEGASPMCGNSICQDRRFLAREMPQLERYFHYRNLDVSSLKELARRWRPDILSGLKKNASHLALDDIGTPSQSFATIASISSASTEASSAVAGYQPGFFAAAQSPNQYVQRPSRRPLGRRCSSAWMIAGCGRISQPHGEVAQPAWVANATYG